MSVVRKILKIIVAFGIFGIGLWFWYQGTQIPHEEFLKWRVMPAYGFTILGTMVICKVLFMDDG